MGYFKLSAPSSPLKRQPKFSHFRRCESCSWKIADTIYKRFATFGVIVNNTQNCMGVRQPLTHRNPLHPQRLLCQSADGIYAVKRCSGALIGYYVVSYRTRRTAPRPARSCGLSTRTSRLNSIRFGLRCYSGLILRWTSLPKSLTSPVKTLEYCDSRHRAISDGS